MKKRTIFGLLLIVTTACMTGCGKQETIPETTSTPVLTQDSEVSSLFTPVEEHKEATISEDVVQKGLCEVLEKKDASKLAEYNVFNRMKTRNTEKDQNSLFCVDQDTGVVYFVNQNKDWYLYRLKDGEAELAVALPVKEVYTWNGIVYFMIESHGIYELDGIKDGDIFSYTPTDGTVKNIYSVSELGDGFPIMTVNEKGIFFRIEVGIGEKFMLNGKEYNTMAELRYYQIPFGSTEPVEDTRETANAGTEDYYLSVLEDSDGKSQLTLVSRVNELPDKELNIGNQFLYCIKGEMLYYSSLGSMKLGVKNITTGETKSYDIGEIKQKVMEHWLGDGVDYVNVENSKGTVELKSFTMAGEYIWVSHDLYLIRIHPESKEMVCYMLDGQNYNIETLYTDGEQLYALYSPVRGGEGHLVQILTDDIGWNEERQLETLGIKYLTE